MYKIFTKTVFLAITLFAAISTGNCASYKVFSVNADSLIHYAKQHGQKMYVKNLNRFSECKIEENILSVQVSKNLPSTNSQKAECLFTLFDRDSLHNGWKVQAVVAVSNGQGQWQYMINPKGKMSLLTMIKSSSSKRTSPISHNIKIKKFILLGPVNAKNWQDSIIKLK